MRRVTYVKRIILPGTGYAQRPFPRLPEAQVKIDDAFRRFIGDKEGYSFILKELLVCSVFKAEGSGEFEDLLSPNSEFDRDQVCAILLYLAIEGWSLLEIPAMKEEISVVVGYIDIDGERMVLYVEHEMEEGKTEEIHLHVVRPNDEEKDTVLVLQMT